MSEHVPSVEPDSAINGSIEDLLVCPRTGGEMRASLEGYRSSQDGELVFPIEEGLIRAFVSHGSIESDITTSMQDFYNRNPFPDYDEGENIGSLVEKSLQRGFPDMLNRSIAPNATVLEVGAGTGQLGNFLSIVGRRMVSVDMTWNSLLLGQKFKASQGLNSVTFAQMNLFRLPLKPARFDVVICTGVLHHTNDPVGGFHGLVPLVKPGGHIIIGLYNKYGRFKTRLRQMLYPMVGQKIGKLDPYLQAHRLAPEKEIAWIEDQYHNPSESLHTIDEVLGWFDDNGVKFVSCLPSSRFGSEIDRTVSLFEPEPLGTRVERLAVQLQQMANDREGGLFIVAGQKR